MTSELILCVPGPWKDRTDFIGSIVSKTNGEFVFAGMGLFCARTNDIVHLDYAPLFSNMATAFEIAGKGKLSASILEQVAHHRSVAYLHFPLNILEQKARVAMFCEALERAGGIAVKVESTGVAHEWDRWFSALNSANPFDLYRTFVVLVGDADQYYSCGMHHFGLPEVEVSRAIEIDAAADLMNRFNYWQIVEQPKIQSGHTFSISPDAPRYRITHHVDARHDAPDCFHNPNGVWRLELA